MPNCSTLYINVSSLAKNYQTLKSFLPSHGKIIGMVKANGYGMGIVPLSKTYLQIGISTLGVSHLSEAKTLREQGILAPILVFSTSLFDLIEAIDLEVEVVISSLEQAEKLNELAKAKSKIVPIHIKIDTGLSRLGLFSSQIPALNTLMKDWKNIKLQGVMTHLMGADLSKFDSFSLLQVQDFEKACSSLDHLPADIHFASSGSIHRFSLPTMTTARIGLALLGYNDSPTPLSLVPAVSLKSEIHSIKTFENEVGIGYHHIDKMKKNSKVGIVPIGYHDGIPSRLSNEAYFLVNGQKALVKGRVYMDFTAIDLTHISAKLGDEVTIFDATHSPSLLANWGNIGLRILLSRLSPRIERIYL